MKLLINIYFYLFPLILIPFMFLLYDGNIFLYNVFSLIIVFVFIVNSLMLKKGDLFVEFQIETISISKYKLFLLVTKILFAVSFVALFIRFFVEEVLTGIGSV